MKHKVAFLIWVFFAGHAIAQVPLFYFTPTQLSPKYGFLPGVKFPIYQTISPHNLTGKKVRLVFADNRNAFSSISCSGTEFQKDSEFEGLYGLLIFKTYIDSLITNAGGTIDTLSGEKTIISLEVLSPQLFGYGKITVHGLCQFTVKRNGSSKTYCADIKDGDENSPLSENAWVTRKTAYRKMTSAGIREAVEKYLIDLMN